MFRRARARDLALAYYRYHRALLTGTTIPDPSDPERTPSTTLSDLRETFTDLATTPSPPPPSDPSPPPVDDEDEDDEADRILIEEIERLEEEIARLEAEAEKEAATALAALGPLNQQKLIDQIEDDITAAEAKAAEADAHAKAGARQAAATARVVQDGARSTIWNVAERDKRVIGYVRLSRTGTPCGWCAMLISRGPVYRSQDSATYKGAASYDDGDKYHDNCNCYAMPIYSPGQYASSSLFDLNRKYAEEWPRVTRGLSGKSAVSAWRRFIRQEARDLELRRPSPTNVQEA
jgi:hypothetical protein